MTKLYFDLETAPLPPEQVQKLMPEFLPAANLKDPAKIEASIAEKKASWLNDCALRAITGQIIAVAVASNENEPFVYHTVPERELIVSALHTLGSQLHQSSPGPIYTWNGSGFDLPFLCARAAVYKFPAFNELTSRFRGRFTWNESFIDAKQVWSMYSPDHRDTSLAKVALALGVGEKIGNGKDFADLLKSDQQKAIEYCKNDVAMLRGIVKAMGI